MNMIIMNVDVLLAVLGCLINNILLTIIYRQVLHIFDAALSAELRVN